MSNLARSPLCGLLLAALAPAQAFVVAPVGGPGIDFTSLPFAVAAVPDGAVLEIRAGTYTGFTVGNKGLTLLADPGVVIHGAVAIAATSATQPFTCRGLSWDVSPGPVAMLSLQNCAGEVLLEDITITASTCVPSPLFPSSCGYLPGIQAGGCPQLTLRDCTMRGLQLTACAAVIESSTLRGEGAFGNGSSSASAAPAIAMADSTLQVAGTSLLVGGADFTFGPVILSGAPAIRATGSFDLRLLDGAVASGDAGGIFGLFAPAIDATSGAVRQDPRATITARVSPPVSGAVVTTVPMPSLTTTGAAPGGAMTAVASSQNGDLVIILLGFPGAPLVLPLFADPVWLDPQLYVFQGFGVQQPGAPVSSGIAVPSLAALRGLRLAWHAVADGPQTGLQVSNPSIGLIR